MTALTGSHLSEVGLKMLSRVPVKVRDTKGLGALLDELVALPRVAGKILLTLATPRRTPQPNLQTIREALSENISKADPNTAVSPCSCISCPSRTWHYSKQQPRSQRKSTGFSEEFRVRTSSATVARPRHRIRPTTPMSTACQPRCGSR